MRIAEIQLGRYGPLRSFDHQCAGDIEVFFGPNESGKTLLLESVLKLLSPDIESVFPAVSRVDEHPSGHLYLETADGEQQLGDGQNLEDVCEIMPAQLRNVFVVRDGDLELRDEHTFYDSVTQRIGDLHTNEIQAIQERLVETGRLTSIDGRGLSRASNRDDAKDVRDSARQLRGDIQAYIEEAEAEDIAGTEREFLSVKAELQQCETELDIQRDAESLARYETLSDRLADYREAVASIDDRYRREELETLRELERQAADAERSIERLSDRRDELRAEIRDYEGEHQTLERELGPLQDREGEIEATEQQLSAYRDAHQGALGADRGMAVAKYAALGGIGLGGVGAVVGSTTAGVVLAIVGLLSLGWYLYQHRSLRAAEVAREQVLDRARDAGLEVSEVDEIAPAIGAFHDRLAGLEGQRDDLAQQIKVNERRVDDVDDQFEEQRDTVQTNREEVQDRLAAVDVDTIEGYAQAVEAQDDYVSQRDAAEQSLVDTLGEPDVETPEHRIEYWEDELEASIEDVEEDVSSERFDADRLDELESEQERLTARRDDLADQLAAHDERLTEFADRVAEISAEPFLEEPLTLEAKTIDGLRDVRPDLARLVERIERDADVAREALDIFDGLKAEEEQKITDLFGPESRATALFDRITGGRYANVAYDTEAQVLTVERDGGEVYTADQLSQGTKAQLYLAARVGLGEELLGSEPGFFLMDDAFLPADGTRLRAGFELLQELAVDGWQVLYFTAKDEVGVDVVEASDLPCRELPPLG